MNPAVTLCFAVRQNEAVGRVSSTLCRSSSAALPGVLVVAFFIGRAFAHPSVNYVVTVLGPLGIGSRSLRNSIIAFFLMSVVLFVSNTPGFAHWTGVTPDVSRRFTSPSRRPFPG